MKIQIINNTSKIYRPDHIKVTNKILNRIPEIYLVDILDRQGAIPLHFGPKKTNFYYYLSMSIIILIFSLILNLLMIDISHSDQFKDGFTAYTQGDHERALKLLQPLAQQGHAGAQFYLGNMYANGTGVKKDINKAMQWFHKAAEQGYATAQWFLGWAYLNGERVGIQKNADEAAIWFLKAAKQGVPEAQYFLGNMYKDGVGVKKDIREAIRWYRKAADQGDLAAQYNLGGIYATGEGVPQSFSTAVEWYYMAGKGYLEAGNRDSAQEAYDRIRKISPGHPLGQKLQESLNP